MPIRNGELDAGPHQRCQLAVRRHCTIFPRSEPQRLIPDFIARGDPSAEYRAGDVSENARTLGLKTNNKAGFNSCDFLILSSALLVFFPRLMRPTQPIAVGGKACINTVPTTKVPDDCSHRARIATYDRRAAVGENCSRYVRFGTPFELRCDGSMADRNTMLHTHH
jgi:hypothetical protein